MLFDVTSRNTYCTVTQFLFFKSSQERCDTVIITVAIQAVPVCKPMVLSSWEKPVAEECVTQVGIRGVRGGDEELASPRR